MILVETRAVHNPICFGQAAIKTFDVEICDYMTYFPPIGCSGDPSPDPEVPIGWPFAEWPTPTPGALTAPAPGAAVLFPERALFCSDATVAWVGL